MKLYKKPAMDLQNDERGFASIVIALIMIIVLALITVGFAQLARREQQAALNKQLAGQAQYAAESGINDAYYDITHNDPTTVSATFPDGYPYIYDNTPSGGGTNASATTCMNVTNPNAHTYHNKQILNSTTGVSYSCLLVDLQPTDIKYDSVDAQSSRYLTFTTDTAPRSFTFFWGSADGKSDNNSQFPADASGGFVPVDSWTHAAVLQVSVTPMGLGSDRASLINNTFTVYLYPASGGTNSISYASSNDVSEGSILTGHCDTATSGNTPCQAQVNFPAALPVGTGPYLIHINDYYDISNISINGTNALGKPVRFIDGQAVIDITGRAKDVLKRLHVHVPIHPSAPVPNDALDGLNICKRFGTYPGSVTPDALPGCDLN